MGNHKIIRTAGKCSMRYSTYDFIESVREHTILWNRSHEDFHNREQRELAWFDVARSLCKDFDEATDHEKQKIAHTLTKRWKNTRDSFFRIRRLQQTDESMTRSYIYEREMSFLVEDVPNLKKERYEREAASNASMNEMLEDATQEYEDGEETNFIAIEYDESALNEMDDPIERENDGEEQEQKFLKRHFKQESSTPYATTAPAAKRVYIQSFTQNANASGGSGAGGGSTVTNSDALEIGVGADDPDQAFFDCVKPVFRDLSVDDKLDFQIEILQLLKSYRAKARYNRTS